MREISKICFVSLIIGLASLYKNNSESQTTLFSTIANQSSETKDLQTNRYFFQDKQGSIKKGRRQHPVLELNVCVKSKDSLNKLPKNWKVSEKEAPNNNFKCSAIAVSYSVVTNFVKAVRRALDSSGLKMDFFEGLTCVDEMKMRKQLLNEFSSEKNKSGHQTASKMIRMAFHDSIDFGNLMSADKLDDKVDDEAPQGLDFCLHTGLQEAKPGEKKDILEDDPDGQPNHNRGLNLPKRIVERIVRRNPHWTKPDVLALGSIVAIGQFFKGPEIPFKMGRRAGDCSMAFCILKQCEDTQEYFLIHQPHAGAMDPQKNIEFFKGAGFTIDEGVALMGAHSVGGVNVCTGNANPDNQAWCQNAAKFPTINETKGKSAAAIKARRSLSQTYFDTTPDKFDNKYYQELVEHFTEDLPTCRSLGQVTERKNRKGKVVRQGKEEQYCTEPVCNARDKKIRYTSLSSEGYMDRELRKVAYLPCDWSLMKNKDAADMEKEYAESQTKFWENFSDAYKKVLNRGYDDDELNSCTSVDCSLNGSKFECDGLNFKTGGDDCNAGEGQGCKLIGGHGTKGLIKCGSNESLKCQMI